MDCISKRIEEISSKKAFLAFLDELNSSFLKNSEEWENRTIDEFLNAMQSWIEDYSSSEFNDIDWGKVDYSLLARILYMGKYMNRNVIFDYKEIERTIKDNHLPFQ